MIVNDDFFRETIFNFLLEKENHKSYVEEFEAKKEKLSEYIDKYGEDNCIDFFEGVNVRFVKPDGTKVETTVKRSQKTSVVFDIEKLKKQLGKECLSKFVKTKISIKNEKVFFRYLKSLGASPQKVKDFLDIESDVDEKSLERLFDVGEVSLKQIKGCYETTKSKHFYLIKRRDDKDEFAQEHGGTE